MPNPFVSIVIPQRGHHHLTRNLLSQLAIQEADAEVVVVNDGQEVAWDGPEHPRFQFVQNTGDGVTAAWNTGCSVARGRWVVLLNNDVECDGPFTERLITACGGQLAISGVRLRREDSVEVLEGWCFAFPRTVWGILNGFDEAMNLYFSDTDFMRRAKMNGVSLHAVAGLPLKHLGHKTAHDRGIRPDRQKVWLKDRTTYFQKHK